MNSFHSFHLNDIVKAELLKTKVRLVIFTFIGVCAGLPSLLLSIRDIINHRKNGNYISVFILLLLTDVLELLLSPYILVKLLQNEIFCPLDWTCWVCWALWWAMKDCGLLLSQLVALEGILSVLYPRYTASTFSSHFFRLFQILIFLAVIICKFFIDKLYFLWFVLLLIIASVIPWIITCGASCSADRHYQTSRKPDRHILVILISTMLVLYLPYAFIFVDYLPPLLVFILLFFTSLRLISDPLLCVLVNRQNLSIQTSPNPEGSSVV